MIVTPQSSQTRKRFKVPEFNGQIGGTRRQVRPCRTERDTIDRIGVSLERAHVISALVIPNLCKYIMIVIVMIIMVSKDKQK